MRLIQEKNPIQNPLKIHIVIEVVIAYEVQVGAGYIDSFRLTSSITLHSHHSGLVLFKM